MGNNEIKNQALKRSLSEILEDPKNVKVKEGIISGHSIEIQMNNNLVFDSYCYYERVKDRDNDLKTLSELLSKKDE